MPSPFPHRLGQSAAGPVLGSVLFRAGSDHSAEVVVRASGSGDPLGKVGRPPFMGATRFSKDHPGTRVVGLAVSAKARVIAFKVAP